MGTSGRLRAEALMLPEAERSELAHALVKSLDAPPDADAADGWDKELMRRLSEIDAGSATLVDRDAFRQRMQARLGSRQCAAVRILGQAAEEATEATAWYEQVRDRA